MFLDRFLSRLDDPSIRESVAQLAADRLLQDRRTLGAFFRDVFGVLDSQIVDAVSSWVLSFLTRPESAQEIAHRLCGLFISYRGENASVTVASALGIDAERKLRLDASLRAGVPRVAEKIATLIMPAVGQALAGNRRFGTIVGVFGAGIGLVVGLILLCVRLID